LVLSLLCLLIFAAAGRAEDAATAPKAAAPSQPAAAKTQAESAEDAVTVIEAFITEQNVDKSKPDWRIHLAKPPKPAFDPMKSYYWDLETNKGKLSIKLQPNVAPMHVASTIYLTKLGFYDGLGFHRVITGFMAQGGDPLGNGMGGPGYTYGGEFNPLVRHTAPGLLSMANAGPNTDGSQFFITFVPTPHLDGKHTIFGGVVDGMDTLRALEAAGSSSGTPKEKLTIISAKIRVE